MKRRAGGWLLIFGGLGIGLVLWFTPPVDASSRDPEAMARRDFDGLVRGVAERYQIHAKSVPIPMMWLVNVCARSVTHGGLHGMKVVEFEDAGRIAVRAGENSSNPEAFGDLVGERLGERWSRTVRTRKADGSESLIYTQNDEDGRNTRLIVVDLDGRELNMVSMSLDAEQLAKWIDEQNARVRRNKSSDTTAVGE